MNSAAAEWVQYYATFLGLSYRERIEMVMAELGRKFGIPDSDGILLTFEPTHSDLAEMIGSSRPVVGRVLTELVEDGEIGRRERKYILLRGGAIEDPRAKEFLVSERVPRDPAHGGSRRSIPLGVSTRRNRARGSLTSPLLRRPLQHLVGSGANLIESARSGFRTKFRCVSRSLLDNRLSSYLACEMTLGLYITSG